MTVSSVSKTHSAWLFRLHVFAIALANVGFFIQVSIREQKTRFFEGLLSHDNTLVLLACLAVLWATAFIGASLFLKDKHIAKWMAPLHNMARHPLALIITLILIASGLLLAWLRPVYIWLWIYLVFLGLYSLLLRSEKAITIIALTSLIAAQIVRLVYMVTAPPFHDEGLYLTVGDALRMGEGLVPAAAYIRPHIPIYPFWGYGNALYGFWTILFGKNLFTLRALNYVLSLAALVPIYATARHLFGSRTALFSLVCLSWSWMFFYAMNARNYGLPLLLTALIIYAHIRLVKGTYPSWSHAGVGLACFLLLEAHSILIIIAFTLALWYLIAYIRRALQQRALFFSDPFWYFVLGALGAALLYLSIHIVIPGLEQYLFIISGVESDGDTGLSALLLPDVSLWRDRLFNAILLNKFPGATIEWVIILASLTLGLIWQRKQAAHWLTLMGLMLVGYTLFDGRGYAIYTVFMAPLAFLGSGLLFTDLDDKDTWLAVKHVAFIALVAVFATSQFRWVAGETRFAQAERQALQRQMQIVDAAYPNRTDEAFFGEAEIIGYLPDQRLYAVSGRVASVGALLNDITPEAYWADAFIKEQPIGFIYPERLPPRPTFQTYLDAYNAPPLEPDAAISVHIIPPNEPLVPYAQQANLNSPAPLQLVAFTPLPLTLSPGDSLTVDAVWLLLTPADHPIEGRFTLHTATDNTLELGPAPLSTVTQPAYTFTREATTLTLPADLPPGDYTLTLTINGDPTNEPHPLGTITVDP